MLKFQLEISLILSHHGILRTEQQTFCTSKAMSAVNQGLMLEKDGNLKANQLHYHIKKWANGLAIGKLAPVIMMMATATYLDKFLTEELRALASDMTLSEEEALEGCNLFVAT